MTEGMFPDLSTEPFKYPHCNAEVLHAPASYNLIYALVAVDDMPWLLSSRRIGVAPWLRARSSTSPVEPALTATWTRAIRVTEPALAALAASLGISQSEVMLLRNGAADVVLSVPAWRGDARPVSVPGDSTTPPTTRRGSRMRNGNDSAPLRHEPSSVPSAASPVRTVAAVFPGTSLSLITALDAGVLVTRPSHDLSVWDSDAFGQSLPSVISSALTATRSELTPEQWQLENVRVSHGRCVYCDHYPSRQAQRGASGGDFTPDEANGWSGNRAAPAGVPTTHMGATYIPDDESYEVHVGGGRTEMLEHFGVDPDQPDAWPLPLAHPAHPDYEPPLRPRRRTLMDRFLGRLFR